MIEDLYSPRTAAVSLIITLATSRAADCLHPLVTACSEVLTRSLGSKEEAGLRQKDGALLAIGSLHEKVGRRARVA